MIPRFPEPVAASDVHPGGIRLVVGRVRLTENGYEERGPSWSPDGTRIVFSCRRGGSDFEICLMNATEARGETKVQQLTNNAVGRPS